MEHSMTAFTYKVTCVLKQLKSPSHSVSDDSLMVKVSDQDTYVI